MGVNLNDVIAFGKESDSFALAEIIRALLERHGAPACISALKPAEGDAGRRHSLVCLADVIPELVKWLWGRRIPLGKITLIEGDPGLGKSTLVLDIAARLSSGMPMPGIDVALEPASALILTAEDGLSDTIRPRLDAAGADLIRIHAFKSVLVGEEGEPPSLPRDLDMLEAAIEEVGAQMVIIDPLMAYLDTQVDSHKDQHIRKVLARLSDMAERTGAAIVIVRHLNKASGSHAVYRGGGSIGIIGAARSALLVARNPNDENGRVLASVKNNLAPTPDSLSFSLEGPEEGAAGIVWGGNCDLSAGVLLAANPASEPAATAQAEATNFLREVLANGPVKTAEVKKEAERAGIAWRTIERAKDTLGVKAKRKGFGPEGEWVMSLPDSQTPPNTAIDSHSKGVAENGEFGGLCENGSVSGLSSKLLDEGQQRGFPSISWPNAEEGCDGWAEGETAWQNRVRLADENELFSAWTALSKS